MFHIVPQGFPSPSRGIMQSSPRRHTLASVATKKDSGLSSLDTGTSSAEESPTGSPFTARSRRPISSGLALGKSFDYHDLQMEDIEKNSFPVRRKRVHRQNKVSTVDRATMTSPSDIASDPEELQSDSWKSWKKMLSPKRKRKPVKRAESMHESVSYSPRNKRLEKAKSLRHTGSFKAVFGRTRKEAYQAPDPFTKDPYLVECVVTIGDMVPDVEFEVQRVPEYDKYLSSLLGATNPGHPDHQYLSRAADRVANMVRERGEELCVVENETKVGNVQDRFPNDDLHLHDAERKLRGAMGRRKSAPGAVLLRSLSNKKHSSGSSPTKEAIPDFASAANVVASQANVSRLYILEGPVQFTVGLQTQERYLFLFNDLLLVAKQKSSTTFKLKHRVRVCELWIASCMDEVSEATVKPDRSFVIGWPTTNAVATFSSPEMKELWLTKLKEQIEVEKGKEQPRVIILKVLNKDMDSYSACKCVTVGNGEEARALIARCLQEFHLQDAEPKDYQLWVVSGKEDAPYPLIGHEHPYSIKMSHVRDGLRDRGSGEDITMPMDVDLNDNNVDVQFVLRQTKKVVRKSSFEDNLKRPKKSKRSPIISFFRRGTKTDGLRGGSPTQGRLFGHNLSDVCDEQALCKPLLDLLQYLFQQGPFTGGVFRKPGNHKRVQEVRNLMDQGENIQWQEEHILVACSILKEFLRSLPDCLFLCDMFDHWAKTLNITEDNDRKLEIKRLIAKLPPAHNQLLRHLVCVFYHILSHENENQMNAQNLAVCIAPSMLWQQATVATGNALADTVHQAEETEKARRLVQYMLDNVEDIFGQEVRALFGPPPAASVIISKSRQDSSTDSDSMHSMLSSHDNTAVGRHDNSSLNEEDSYYTEPEPSPQLLTKAHLSPTNLSRDSGLTNSDPRLYDDVPEVLANMDRHRKHSMTRSVSQQDQPNMPRVDASCLSRSYDCTLDVAHAHVESQPIPPPRSKKGRRGSPSDTDDDLVRTPSRSTTSPNFAPQTVPMLIHSSSALTLSDFRKQKRSFQQSKHMSGDSLVGYLGSVEEDQDPLEEQDTRSLSHQTLPPKARDIGVLQKSESGTRLFIRDDSMTLNEKEAARARQRARQNRKSAPPDVAEVQRMLKEAKANVYVPHEQSVSAVTPRHRPQPTSRTSSNTPHFHVAPPDESPDEGEDSVLHYTYMVPVTNKEYTSNDSSQSMPSVTTRVQVKSNSHELTSETPKRSGDGVRSRQPSRPTQLIMSGETQSPRAKVLTRSNAVELTSPPPYSKESLYRKGMTPKGADMFPTRVQFYRKSLDEGTVLNLLEDGRSSSMPRDSGSSQSSHKVGAKIDPAIQRLRCSPAIERSASESSLHEQMQRQRPRNPPSYQEAIQRKASLQNAQISQQEIEKQRHKNAIAKKLYEESLRKLQDEEFQRAQSQPRSRVVPDQRERSNSTDGLMTRQPLPSREKEKSVPKQPPSYEHACQRAEQIREQRKDRTPPRYSKKEAEATPAPTCQPVTSDQAVHIVRKGSDHLKERLGTGDNVCTSRESTPTRSDSSSRDSSMNRKHRRRSKERRIGHRNSDTRLNVATKAARMNSSNLNRSKSDSSEHIHKAYKFKDLATSDNKENVSSEDLHSQQQTIEKLEKLQLDLTHKPSLDKLEKMAKDLENEKMRREKMSKSAENISYKLLAENLSMQESIESQQQKERKVSLTRSVKNRNWHKDLAEQYSAVTYQPEETGPRYHYKTTITIEKSQDKEAPRQRKWVPPVHPTKDLVLTYDRDNGKPNSQVRRVQSNVSDMTYHKTPSKQQEFDTRGRSNSDAPPPQTYRGEAKRVGSEACAQISEKLHETMADASVGSEEHAVGISWSVSQLRNLYSGGARPTAQAQGREKTTNNGAVSAQGYYTKELPRDQHQTANSLTRGQQPYNPRQVSNQRERTNPNAEEAYV